MTIQPAADTDLELISSLIRKEFPYTEATLDKLRQRLAGKKLFLFKQVEGGQLIGFIEVEALNMARARINGLVVREGFRGKGNAHALLQFAMDFIKQQGFKEITLLVRQSNEAAKKLYGEHGFAFLRPHAVKLVDEPVEEWYLSLFPEPPCGVC